MSALTLTTVRSNLLWRALWNEMDRLEKHPDNMRYRTGREDVLKEMREVREMLREINRAADILTGESLEDMLNAYTFESEFTYA